MGIEYLSHQRGGVFSIGTRVSYPIEGKIKVIELKLEGKSTREIL